MKKRRMYIWSKDKLEKDILDEDVSTVTALFHLFLLFIFYVWKMAIVSKWDSSYQGSEIFPIIQWVLVGVTVLASFRENYRKHNMKFFVSFIPLFFMAFIRMMVLTLLYFIYVVVSLSIYFMFQMEPLLEVLMSSRMTVVNDIAGTLIVLCVCVWIYRSYSDLLGKERVTNIQGN